jgi:galactose-1-phosphate uridylyltransferase
MEPTQITLRQMELVGEIDIHEDILSITPSALSLKRALKKGRIGQKPMEDKDGAGECILCNEDKKKEKNPNTSPHETEIPNRVAGFKNDYPYLPGDQRVLFLWHESPVVRHKALHKFRLQDFGKLELYWLLRACVERGKNFEIPKQSTDLWRMVVGFNLGSLAGQSIPHFHVQYGWEVALNPKTVQSEALALYFKELSQKHLVIHEDNSIRFVAPWTPKGQYATELYFKDKFEFRSLTDIDLKLFAVFGEQIVRKYMDLGIQNVNIVFTNSPVERETEPLVAHFVPRVNMAALYEIKGVNVVDTPPEYIAVEFTKVNSHRDESKNVLWPDVAREAAIYDPEATFDNLIRDSRERAADSPMTQSLTSDGESNVRVPHAFQQSASPKGETVLLSSAASDGPRRLNG